MKRLFALLPIVLAAVSCIQDPDAPMNLPDIPVISVDETSVTRVSMLVNGVFGKDMADITAYGVEVSETLFENGGTYQTLAPQEVTGGAFSLGVTGLKSNSTYFLRAFISNGHSKMYSSIITQQTPETSVASVSDVTVRDGFLVASIEDNGGRSVEDVGFMWGTSSERKELKREKRYVGTLSEDGKTFTLPLSVVGYGTYYVMAYAEDDKDGTGYSRIPFNLEMKDPSQPNSEIWYTSVDGVVVNPTVKDGFGARIVSNTNEDGKGVIAFDGPVTRIPESAFRQSRLVTITLPDSVEGVGRYAFDQNGAEKTLEAFYGKGASQDHLSLVIGGTLVAVARMNEELDFVIPDGVTTIGWEVFAHSIYKSITIPEGLRYCENAFPNQIRLEAFYGPNTSEDHRCVIIDGEIKAFAADGLTSYEVTEPLTSIGNYAFYNKYSQVGRLILPESATYVGSQAFGQTQIDTLGLPAHLKEIRDEAFYDMFGLITLTIPEEVETIGSRAFGQAGKDYGGLYNITFLPTVPPVIKEDTFAELQGDGPFYVPAESVEAYKTARYWSAYADRIRGILVEDVTEAVDLGLSVKWASMNLGASSPEEFGDYYAWGETETKENYNWVTYTWCDGDYNKLTKYNTSSSYGTIDNKTVMDPEDDVAHVKLGEKWRLPTSSEIDELVSTRDNASYQWEWKSLNGHNGWLVTYLVNNNSIFLPAAGRHENTGLGRLGELGDYWSSSIKGEPCYAYHVDFDIGYVYTIHAGERYKGLSVRPVWGERSDESVSASKYLTFSSEGSTTISLSPGGDVDLLLYISFDGQTWSQWDYSSLTFTASNPLYMCGKNPSGLDSSRFVTSGDNFSVDGNIMSLLDKDEDLLVVPVYGFMNLFINNTGLVSAPSMPATSLGSHSYTGMYQGCISLTSAPALPATEVAMFAYQKMFSGCTSLNDAPELPATTIHINSYDGMFNGCTSLKTAPALSATDLSDADFCYKGMFEGCSGLTDAPELPATSLGTGCYQNMFIGCTSLTIAPELPASSLIDSCYKSMFSGCDNLSYVKCLAIDISATDCVNNWLSNVAATGTFVKAPNTQWPSGASGIPSGWTVEDAQ